MKLIEIFIPLTKGDGSAVTEEAFANLRTLLTDKFGGVTEFSRSPAHGAWKEGASAPTERDEIVVVEVMTESLNRGWWQDLRKRLEGELGQDEIVIRAHSIERL